MLALLIPSFHDAFTIITGAGALVWLHDTPHHAHVRGFKRAFCGFILGNVRIARC